MGKPDSGFFISYYCLAWLCQVVSHADSCNFTLSAYLLLDPKLSWDYMDTHGFRGRPCCWVWGSTTPSFPCDGSGGIPASVMMGSHPSHIFCLRGRSGEGKGEERSWKWKRAWKLELDLAIWNFSPQVGNSRIASNSWCKDLCWCMMTFRIPSIYRWPQRGRFTSKSYL